MDNETNLLWSLSFPVLIAFPVSQIQVGLIGQNNCRRAKAKAFPNSIQGNQHVHDLASHRPPANDFIPDSHGPSHHAPMVLFPASEAKLSLVISDC